MAPKKAARVSDVLGIINTIAPFRLAESWDNVGLHVGDPAASAGTIMVALEATTEVVAAARRERAGLLVTHHPLFFRDRKQLAESDPVSRIACELIRSRMGLIAAHTNLDSTADGTNGELADLLGLAPARTFLRVSPNPSELVKFAVFVPLKSVDAIIATIGSAGGGMIGNYSHCTFRAAGTGTFKPLEGANPHIGSVGALEQVEEARIEAVCERGRATKLVDAVRAAHPYEEMAFDLMPMEPDTRPRFGLGLAGELAKPATLAQVAKRMSAALPDCTPRIVGDARKRIRTVALCTGAGGDFIRRGQVDKFDLFVTGEINHHDAWEARERGIAALLVGHHASEVIVCWRLAGRITDELRQQSYTNRVLVSGAQRDPISEIR